MNPRQNKGLKTFVPWAGLGLLIVVIFTLREFNRCEALDTPWGSDAARCYVFFDSYDPYSRQGLDFSQELPQVARRALFVMFFLGLYGYLVTPYWETRDKRAIILITVIFVAIAGCVLLYFSLGVYAYITANLPILPFSPKA